MKLLVVSPDYASHVGPMLQIAREWKRSTGPVVVASGPHVRAAVEREGLEWTELRLGRGNNAGVMRVDEQPIDEDAHLREFFAATRIGAFETLRYQALARGHDLMFEPERVTSDLSAIMRAVRPDRVLVDHVAFGARLALHALDIAAASIVLGHPTALPAPGELYGLPPAWPSAFRPSPTELVELTEICATSTMGLTVTANRTLRRLAPARPPIADITALPGNPTIYMYPSALHDPQRRLPDGSTSIGSLRRLDPPDELPIPTGSGPLVVMSLGTFLSERDDLLATALQAATLGGWRLILASGSTPLDRLGEIPRNVVVREHLPQVALLDHADAFITHGGNNSVTEASAAGVPMIVLPLSTDQFAGAAAIERVGAGVALDPNRVTAPALAESLHSLLASSSVDVAHSLADAVTADGGPVAAVHAIKA